MATLAEIQARLTLYRAAEMAILTGGQAIGQGNRSLTRADLPVVQKMIAQLELQEAELAGTVNNLRIKLQRVVPRSGDAI
jgi:hypothetical protein